MNDDDDDDDDDELLLKGPTVSRYVQIKSSTDVKKTFWTTSRSLMAELPLD